MACGDLDVAEVDACVEHGGDEGVAQHVWVHTRQPHHRHRGQAAEPSCSAVAVHAAGSAVEQDRPTGPVADSPVESAADCGRQRHESDLGALSDHAQNPVAVFLTDVGHVGAAGLEDPQPE